MTHTHDHSHHANISQANENKVLLAFTFIFSFMVIECLGGLWTGSLALLADAGHMLTDAAALALAYAAFRLGRRAANNKHTFGYLRFEVIASLINALTLLGMVLWIVVEAWARWSSPSPIMTGSMMLIAFAGLLVNVLVLWIMTRGEQQSMNIQGAILHVIGDLLGSVAAIVAALLMDWTGWTWVDPLLSVLLALLIARSAWALLRQSVHILLEGAPDHALPEHIEQSLCRDVPELAAVNHIHVWQLTSGQTIATLHIRPKNEQQARLVHAQVAAVLQTQFQIEHATIAIDWSNNNIQATTPNAPCHLLASHGLALH